MKNKLQKKIIASTCLIFLSWGNVFLFAQKELADTARKLYPEKAAIFLIKKHEYKIYLEKGQLKVNSSVKEQVLVNKEAGLSHHSKSVTTSDFVQVQNIKANTLVPKGNKYSSKKVTQIELKSNPSRYSFYDDQKSYDLTFPFVETGCITDLEYECVFTEPRLCGSFYFADFIPVLKNELVISVQKGIDIKYTFFHDAGANIKFDKKEGKNETVYTWSVKNVDDIKYYNDAPNFRYFEPHMVFYIDKYTYNDSTYKILSSPAELHDWYNSLLKNVNQTKDEKLKAITDSLVQGVDDELEKVKKIFYWVQDKISYVAFEDGFGGFIPRDAGLVCSRRFGDCKDMASLIREMLGFAGIPSYLTWIGSRSIPYTYKEVPTPISDNHMITSYLDKNGQWHFYDGTGKNAPFDLYTSMIQGKEALISIRPDSFLIVTVPIKDPSISQTIDSINIQLKDKVLYGKGKVTLTGYDRLDYYYRTQNFDKEKSDEFFKNYYSKGNNKSQFSEINLIESGREAPYIFTYKCEIPDYISLNEKELYINLNLDKSLIMEPVEEDRKIPVNFKHLTKKTLVTTFEIPEGYAIQFVPENSQYISDICKYINTYEVKGNTIIHKTEIYVNTLLLTEKMFGDWNKMIKQIIKSNKEAVSLLKK